jgi:hypothetical protein
VAEVVFSPDGRRLASAGGYDNTVRVWDIGAPPIVHEELARLQQQRAALPGPASKTLDAATTGPGDWAIEGNEIVQRHETGWPITLTLGDPRWTDYDIDVEAQKISGINAITVAFRIESSGDFMQADLGREKQFTPLQCRVDNKLEPLTPKRDEVLEPGRWYRAHVEVRGDKFRYLLNGTLLAEAQDPRHPQGAVGLRMWRTTARFRNLKVTAPDGTVLFAGVPRLHGPWTRTAEELDERIAILRQRIQ